MRALGLLTAPFVTLLALSFPARAQEYGERVLSFHADVTVNPDASLDVVETIRVAAGGQQIDHGIYRDFPTRRRGLVNHLFPFEVRGATRDGAPEPYTVSQGGDAAHVKIGAPDAHLPIGLHEYVLTYRTWRQLRAFADHDELYWNVTGSGWTLPIDVASADVHLPPAAAAAMRELYGYYGPEGSTARVLHAERRGDVASFRTTLPLAAREGLTVSVSWPKGLVRLPDAREQRAWLLRDNALLGLGALLVGALALYTWTIGSRRRREAERARAGITVVTEPPDVLSPAALHAIQRLNVDDTTFAAALIGMADKGALKLGRDADGTYTVTARAEGRDALAPEERTLAEALFRGAGAIALSRANAATISSARGSFTKALKTSLAERYYVRRGRAALGGLALALAAAAALAASGPGEARLGAAFITVWASFWTIAVVALLKNAATAWAKVGRDGYAYLPGAIFGTLFAVVFSGAEIGVLVAYGAMASPVAAVLFAAVLVLGVRLVGWLAEPTALGVRVRAAADAYREYLQKARPEQWRAAGTPPPFAYAFALGIAPRWEELAHAGAVTATSPLAPFRPFWWRNDTWDHSSFSELGASLPSAVTSATSSSSSSSGSGGGGSSGGGGGGGGGGGW
jgi:uncharacterized membrane protein YgcG